jgi:hypothetical protein
MAEHERFIEDLSEKEKKILAEVIKQKHVAVEVLSEWTDDHQPCLGVKINGIEFGVWWLDVEGAGAFHYSDSKKAQKIIKDVIKGKLEQES